jgi:hypothetical protein
MAHSIRSNLKTASKQRDRQSRVGFELFAEREGHCGKSETSTIDAAPHAIAGDDVELHTNVSAQHAGKMRGLRSAQNGAVSRPSCRRSIGGASSPFPFSIHSRRLALFSVGIFGSQDSCS